jgi:hypothetical protein
MYIKRKMGLQRLEKTSRGPSTLNFKETKTLETVYGNDLEKTK